MLGFGPHLTIDGYGCNRDKLQDLELIYSVLDTFPSKIGMTRIMPPYVFRYQGAKKEDWGISGFVLIAESHISIHTFPCKDYISVDIFSCKEFNIQKAITYMKEIFEIKKLNESIFNRGLDFPKNIEKSVKIVSAQRKKVTQSSITPIKAREGRKVASITSKRM